ncbi:hypothetical protein [Microvirga tunisiensis]|uniref:Uncharacterized protein n=1 Tax=Microvirga tunisiensis TaxID=2108360 RepID=A0A5N7MVL3_9HYPH|nr:hypothetical protein [Microvirga tunisiensis]MPR12188.1 hypothetical protein [Microvirga tunisiensis]MPR30134.1 hypothetical protein [Microvirga tunisiensis]
MTTKSIQLQNTLEKAVLVAAVGRQLADYASIPAHIADSIVVVGTEKAACADTLERAKALKLPGILTLPAFNRFQMVLALEAYARSSPEKDGDTARLLIRRVERESKVSPGEPLPVPKPIPPLTAGGKSAAPNPAALRTP